MVKKVCYSRTAKMRNHLLHVSLTTYYVLLLSHLIEFSELTRNNRTQFKIRNLSGSADVDNDRGYVLVSRSNVGNSGSERGEGSASGGNINDNNADGHFEKKDDKSNNQDVLSSNTNSIESDKANLAKIWRNSEMVWNEKRRVGRSVESGGVSMLNTVAILGSEIHLTCCGVLHRHFALDFKALKAGAMAEKFYSGLTLDTSYADRGISVTAGEEGERRESKGNRGLVIMTISKVDVGHAGEYGCFVSDSGVKTVAQLVLLESEPICSAVPANTSYDQNHSSSDQHYTLSCNVAYIGNLSPPIMSWSLDGHIINATSHTQVPSGSNSGVRVTSTLVVTTHGKIKRGRSSRAPVYVCRTFFRKAEGQAPVDGQGRATNAPHYQYNWTAPVLWEEEQGEEKEENRGVTDMGDGVQSKNNTVAVTAINIMPGDTAVTTGRWLTAAVGWNGEREMDSTAAVVVSSASTIIVTVICSFLALIIIFTSIVAAMFNCYRKSLYERNLQKPSPSKFEQKDVVEPVYSNSQTFRQLQQISSVPAGVTRQSTVSSDYQQVEEPGDQYAELKEHYETLSGRALAAAAPSTTSGSSVTSYAPLGGRTVTAAPSVGVRSDLSTYSYTSSGSQASTTARIVDSSTYSYAYSAAKLSTGSRDVNGNQSDAPIDGATSQCEVTGNQSKDGDANDAESETSQYLQGINDHFIVNDTTTSDSASKELRRSLDHDSFPKNNPCPFNSIPTTMTVHTSSSVTSCTTSSVQDTPTRQDTFIVQDLKCLVQVLKGLEKEKTESVENVYIEPRSGDGMGVNYIKILPDRH